LEISNDCLNIDFAKLQKNSDEKEGFSKYNFSNYAKGGFSLKNHWHLRDLAIQYSNEINCTVIISNHDTNEIRDLYKDANEIVSFNVKRTISSKATNRTQAPELLAIYRV
jgi:site-specific DNA-adenine methylase